MSPWGEDRNLNSDEKKRQEKKKGKERNEHEMFSFELKNCYF